MKARYTTAQDLTIRENGDANSYSVLADDDWLFLVIQNGEMLVDEQRKNMKLIAEAPVILENLNLLYDFVEEVAMRIPADEFNEQFRAKFNPIMTKIELTLEKINN